MSDTRDKNPGNEGKRASLLAKLDEVEIEIEKLIAGGDGFGHIQCCEWASWSGGRATLEERS